MSRTRAAAKKKPQPTASPPKKRKTLNPKTTISSVGDKIQEISEEPSKDLENPISNHIDKPQDSEKRPKSTSSSPKKHRTVETKIPKTENSSVHDKIQENSEEPSKDLQKHISNESIKPQDSVEAKPVKESVNAAEKPGKKVNIAELKSKIVLLKKKAGDFDPKMVASWEKGERVPFILLSLVFDMISNETGRIVITDVVCNMLRAVMETTPEDLVPVVYLAANKIAPSHEGLDLGIGDGSIIKALAEACGRTETLVKKQYKEVGKDSQEKKKNRIEALLVAATNCKPQYLIVFSSQSCVLD